MRLRSISVLQTDVWRVRQNRFCPTKTQLAVRWMRTVFVRKDVFLVGFWIGKSERFECLSCGKNSHSANSVKGVKCDKTWTRKTIADMPLERWSYWLSVCLFCGTNGLQVRWIANQMDCRIYGFWAFRLDGLQVFRSNGLQVRWLASQIDCRIYGFWTFRSNGMRDKRISSQMACRSNDLQVFRPLITNIKTVYWNNLMN